MAHTPPAPPADAMPRYSAITAKRPREIVLLRGKIVAKDGKFVGELGQGEFIRSEAGGYCFK